jgi:hypothetical protein
MTGLDARENKCARRAEFTFAFSPSDTSVSDHTFSFIHGKSQPMSEVTPLASVRLTEARELTRSIPNSTVNSFAPMVLSLKAWESKVAARSTKNIRSRYEL